MADESYFAVLNAKVELNLSDFRKKMMLADAELDEIAASPEVTERGGGFTNVADAMIDAAIGQMEDFVAGVMEASQEQVPKDTEVLANSARPLIRGGFRQPVVEEAVGVGVPALNGNRVEVVFGYGYGTEINPKTGRMAAQYATPVHEIYEAEHAPPTKSHYLVDPLMERAGDFGVGLKMAMEHEAEIASKSWSREVVGVVSKTVFLFRKGGGQGIPAVFGEGGIQKRRAHEPGWKKDLRSKTPKRWGTGHSGRRPAE